jgi:hypothetical protein
VSYRPVKDFPRSNQPGRSTTLNHDQHMRALSPSYSTSELADGDNGPTDYDLRGNEGQTYGADLVPNSTGTKNSRTGR